MKKNLQRLLQATTLSLCALGFAAQAQTQPGDARLFEQMDTNHDGKVSRAEYQAFMEQAFAKLDANKDGQLSRAETATVFTDGEFAMLDKNKKGTISRAEFMDAVMADFKAQDRDGDGFLTR